MDHKVYVMLGFHINFYHSWRGDTPDEAGFGTDIRVMRGVLDILDHANAIGKKARGYWDTEVYWTFQEILPKHCPDILERIRQRVAAGQDEIVLGPFNNGANHAATADEFRAAVAWAIENPWGSGLRQLFPKVTPFYRPQECVFTTGQEKILKECGVEGLLLYYALVPFNTLGVFTPALPLERRYNPFWFRSRDDQPRLVLFPCMSAADVLDMGSLELMMLDLHIRQVRGEIRSDVVIHLNEDADLESWLPIKIPPMLRWFPNTGGLEEYISLVNKYPWADFSVPSEYLTGHPPTSEVLVRQDLADGAFDGSYSWAEKYTSLLNWTLLEQSRLFSQRAEAMAKQSGIDLETLLWEGMESSFFKRLIGLSTTHFGMSTPVINEERQARATAILSEANQLAAQAERKAADAIRKKSSDGLYEIELFATPPDRDREATPARCAVRLPLILPAEVQAVQVSEDGKPVKTGLTDLMRLPDGRMSCEARFVTDMVPGESRRFQVNVVNMGRPAKKLAGLKNEWLQVDFSEGSGVRSFQYRGDPIGGRDFLQPFVTYRTKNKPVVYPATRWEFLPLDGEQWDGLQRVRLRAVVPMETPHGEYCSEFTYTFMLFDALPQLFVDVEARYAVTPSTETIHNMIQKLRRLLDLGWIEVAPFQIHPLLDAPEDKPVRVWKHNYLGVTAYYDLNYGQINPRNRNLDSFNHQVTAGWVAVSDGKKGLLVGENADLLASMAFCPMRLREENGKQCVWLNPFGSYHGEQADYSHLGANGSGGDFLKAFSGFLRPNGPSYNGQSLHFALMLAPYEGDEPPPWLQSEAAAHFYPPGILFHATPEGVESLLPVDLRRQAEDVLRQAAMAGVETVPTPTAFLANPSRGLVDLVWETERDKPVTGTILAWRARGEVEWREERLPPCNRWQVNNLEDGREYDFKLRATCEGHLSEWTREVTCRPGAVSGSNLGGGFALLPKRTLVRLVTIGVWSAMRGLFRR